MRKCQECDHDNLVGAMVCEDCGFPLMTGQSGDAAAPVYGAVPVHTAGFDLRDEMRVYIEFVGFETRIELKPNAQTTFGRQDTNGAANPDVDLTPYGAFEKGVSRTHALMQRREHALMLQDLGSSNGTLVNGRRVAANQPRLIQDGDEIMFGQLAARVHFV
ncbi:MAG: FHA domain-containing protein [Chloroflexi bacterium]|nr:MAG: FHA domain-containing protein [Chloroflexi bacterium OLB13]MBC6956470.1 FHA domain-containing protein [Chloroflexota bacterium]MBW7879226.1 FHA domain-containing protein [Anaerolineae bacterium]MDL1915998.1 FHA domain-containing protein [Anaerolineae bacterium CFX4]OQY84427.1 MAG: hypothetical protein B6D42_05300 [Anaerolineae bacterium UTCFX5]